MIRFNANLYRIAMLCSSNEETRHYLQGAYAEPHPVKGVTLVATDGHKLVAIYDENGFADESAIVKLNPAALKACKPGRDERRDVVIYTGSADAIVMMTECDREGVDTKGNKTGAEILTDTPIAFSKDCKVDGTFPDYHRVFPSEIKKLDAMASPSFSTLVTASMTEIALQLALHYGEKKSEFRGVARYNSSNAGGPSLVTFPPTFNAVAVAMPMRSICEATAPAWFTGQVVPLAQAAE